MTLKPVSFATAGLTLLLLAPLYAQIPPAVQAALAQGDAGIVLGEPCIIIQKKENVQQLVDGTMLTHRREEHKWRDSQGRFRRQGAEVDEGRDSVFRTATIVDPTNNTIAILNMERKTAVVYHLPDHGPGSLQPYVDVDDLQHPALPGVQVKVDKLDPKTIDGVYAVGIRVTRVRPPGTIGNDKPVVSVRERWDSPDLKIVLFASSDDPREKDTSEITKLDRNEPDPNLFTVPEGFSIREVTVHASQRAAAQ